MLYVCFYSSIRQCDPGFMRNKVRALTRMRAPKKMLSVTFTLVLCKYQTKMTIDDGDIYALNKDNNIAFRKIYFTKYPGKYHLTRQCLQLFLPNRCQCTPV